MKKLLLSLKGRDDLKVLFVYPWFPDAFWSFRHALEFIGKLSAFPPLGLLTISSMLPPTWNRRLVDLNVCELLDKDILEADIVFASAMIVQQKSLREVIDRCHRLGRPIVVGGPFPSTGLKHVEDADCIFVGEAETTLPDFVNDLRLGIPQHVYQNPKNDKGEEIMPDIKQTPIPDWSIFRMRDRYDSVLLQFSRGCPFKCEFCDIIEIYGRVPRVKSVPQMLAEFDALYDTGWRGRVFLVDDNLIGNKKAVKELLRALIPWMESHDYPFSFNTEASLNLAEDDELLQLMYRAGFRKVFLGIETPVAASLKEAQKGQNKGDMLQAVRKIQSHGLEVTAGFIIGFDHDPEDIFQRMVAFIKESAIPMAMVGLLQALPNTQLWRRLDREGRSPQEESTGNNTDCSMNFVPIMDRATIANGYKWVMRTIYKPAEYYARVLELFRRTQNFGPALDSYGPVESIKAGLRIVFRLGLLDRYRMDFWRFLFQVARQRVDLIPEAMAHAAKGYHQRLLVEAYE